MRLAPVTAAVLALLVPAAAGANSPSLEGHEVRGSLGDLRIGGYLVIQDGTTFVRGHYFYASQLKDIPLSGVIAGDAVTLTGSDGSTFRLHFVGNGSNAGQPPSFANSVGLAGTWAEGAKTLPATLDFDWAAAPMGRLYADVTDEPDAAFETRVAHFLHAVTGGDRQGAAALVDYPLRVNGTKAFQVRDEADLLAHWDRIFTPPMVARLREAIPHEMFVHDGQAMVGRGEVWFDAKGAVSINPPQG